MDTAEIEPRKDPEEAINEMSPLVIRLNLPVYIGKTLPPYARPTRRPQQVRRARERAPPPRAGSADRRGQLRGRSHSCFLDPQGGWGG